MPLHISLFMDEYSICVFDCIPKKRTVTGLAIRSLI